MGGVWLVDVVRVDQQVSERAGVAHVSSHGEARQALELHNLILDVEECVFDLMGWIEKGCENQVWTQSVNDDSNMELSQIKAKSQDKLQIESSSSQRKSRTRPHESFA